MPALEHGLHDVQNVRAHEGLATGNADFLRTFAERFDLIQEGRHIREREIDKIVIGRRAFDVAVHAFNVAERAGIQPERLQAAPVHAAAHFALGGEERVLKLLINQSGVRHGNRH